MSCTFVSMSGGVHVYISSYECLCVYIVSVSVLYMCESMFVYVCTCVYVYLAIWHCGYMCTCVNVFMGVCMCTCVYKD